MPIEERLCIVKKNVHLFNVLTCQVKCFTDSSAGIIVKCLQWHYKVFEVEFSPPSNKQLVPPNLSYQSEYYYISYNRHLLCNI